MGSHTSPATRPTIHVLTRCDERIRHLGLKGAKADNEAIAFLAGACAAVENSDPLLYSTLGNVLALVVSVRGVFGLRESLASLKRNVATEDRANHAKADADSRA